jgi:putative peptide zinc metalloprotease protein
MRRRFALILLQLFLAAGIVAAVPAAASDDAGGGDNSAVAVNTKDGASVFRFAFKISHEGGDLVDNENTAVAYSSCAGCRTSAIAIQVVLVTGNPSAVTPVNLALALNDQCTSCATFASAYQFVRSTHGPATFTSDGRQEIASIKGDLRALKDSELSPPELQERVGAAAERLRVVLDTQLVPAGSGDDGVEDEDDRQQEDLAPAEQPTSSSVVEKESQTVAEAPVAQ